MTPEHGQRHFALVEGWKTVVSWSVRWERWTDLTTGYTYAQDDPRLKFVEDKDKM